MDWGKFRELVRCEGRGEIRHFGRSDHLVEEHLGEYGVVRCGRGTFVTVEGGEDSRSSWTGGSENGTHDSGGTVRSFISDQ